MALEAQISGMKAIDLLDTFASCMTHVGTREFFQHYLEVIEGVVRADQCMIFSYSDSGVSCYLSYNARMQENGRVLAEQYIMGGYLDDPLLPRIQNLEATGGFEVLTFSEIKDLMPVSYLEKYFVEPGLIDKVSIIAKGHGETLAISFYRYSENGEFTRSTPALRNAFWRVIAQLVLLHYSQDGAHNLKSPLASLSERERDVCEGIMRGLTTEGIAGELALSPNSVTTYRKRAYVKLGINSKTALFALCKKSL
ncbi:MAG: helix-turn-helix transcriptional regulator [Betaproteobacteria bacterium]|nr:helix-turn-helix transcriptional regulator [Betaproteobacteria bacterium]